MSGLDPSSAMIAPRYLNLLTQSSFSPLTLMSVLIAIGVVGHQFGLLCIDLHTERYRSLVNALHQGS